MKYLFMLAVVGEKLFPEVRRIASSPGLSEATAMLKFFRPSETCCDRLIPVFERTVTVDPRATDLYRLVSTAVTDAPDRVAFYRVLMDGWDASHVGVMPLIGSEGSEAQRAWLDFIKYDFMVFSADSSLARESLPLVTAGGGATEAGTEAFWQAFIDCLVFCRATEGLAVMTATCLGPSMSDEEYVGKGAK
jgi:hypothetical protein